VGSALSFFDGTIQDLVITDNPMKAMGGAELARSIKLRFPSIRVMASRKRVRIIEWRTSDLPRLADALRQTKGTKLHQRVLALRLVATGRSVSATARFVHCSRQAVYHWLKRYGRHHRIADLRAVPCSGRPKQAPVLTDARILKELRRGPTVLGYSALTWTVPLMTGHLQRRYRCRVSPWTVRRRLKRMGVKWKRLRYR
jgi:transposase